MIFRSRLFNTVFPLALLASAPAWAEMRALLVGVSDYHVLDADLKGPQNDVRLLARALMTRGADPARIAVLTTPGATLDAGLAPAVDPTRQAILDGLDRLATEAGPGDTVIFYYSGHGSQAPDMNGDEQGGYDEIILPSDSADWKGAIGAVENAIVDDELQVKMQAILDTGATLVAILDACHSATGFRAAGGVGEARYIAPQSLGIPDAAIAAAEGGHVAPPLTGDFVFLYSSQSDERSFEYPVGDPADLTSWYGDFTRNLTQVLAEVPDLTWAQALAASADGLRQEQASQTPDGEGPALDRPVFGSGGTGGRMRIEAGALMAGLLSGLNEGAEIAIYDAAAGGTRLGTARLVEVKANGATLDGGPALPPTAYAEVLSPGRPAALRLALPEVADDGDYSAAQDVLAQSRDLGLADDVDWVEGDADLRLIFVDGDLVLVGRDGVLDPQGPGSSPRVAADADGDTILGFVARAAALHRLDTALAAAEGRKGGLSLPGAGLKVEAVRSPAARAGGACAEPDEADAALKDGGTVSDCDQVWLKLSNGSKTAQDVTVLYVDRDMNVLAIWPDEGLSNRIGFGETAEVGMQIEDHGVPVGTEQIVVIAVPARDGAPRTVLTGLADPSSSRGIGGGTETGDWLMAAVDAGDDTGLRALPGRTDPVKVTRIRVALTE